MSINASSTDELEPVSQPSVGAEPLYVGVPKSSKNLLGPRHFKAENLIDAIVFLGTIAFFTCASVYSGFNNTSSVATSENRKMAAFPIVRSFRKDLPKFATGFEKFYNDRFAFRLPMVATRNLFLLDVFSSSGNSLVAVGKDSWLYYAAKEALNAQANTAPFSELSLALWGKTIQSRSDFLAAHGIKYLFVIPPEKGSIYNEHLPAGIHVRPGVTRLDQLQKYLKDHTSVDFVDAKSLLLKEKGGENGLYHTVDTHWNQYGAFLVVQEMFRHLHKNFAAVKPYSSDEVRITTDYPFKGDLAKMLGLGAELAERCVCVVMLKEKAHPQANIRVADVPNCQEPSFAWIHPDQSLPRAFVLRDSFTGYLIPLIAERMKQTEYHWAHSLIPDLVLQQKPDVVIDEVAERHLYDYEPDNVPTFAKSSEVAAKADHGTSAEKVYSANYDNKFLLENVKVSRIPSGLKLQLFWKSLISQKLVLGVGVHTVSKLGAIVGTKDYQQDSFKRSVEAGDRWVDIIEIPSLNLPGARDLGIVLYPNDTKAALPAKAARTDWGVLRVLISIDDVLKGST